MKKILIAIHCIVLVMLWAVILNKWISPSVFPYLNLLSLAFPILIIAYSVLTIFSIFCNRKLAGIFLLLGIMFITPVKRWVGFSSKKGSSASNLKVITFNIKNGYGFKKEDLISYSNEKKAQLFFLQEAGALQEWKPYLKGYYSYTDIPHLAIYSTYEILEKGVIFDEPDTGKAIYAVINHEGQKIRLVNVYLEPFFITKSMVKPGDHMEANTSKLRLLLHKLAPTFKIHQKQVDSVSHFLENTEEPIILAGDFNAVPNSYEYFQLKNGLVDSFQKEGTGFGASFYDYKFPIRIDYIFASKNMTPVNSYVDKSVDFSDHFPVVTEYHMSKK